MTDGSGGAIAEISEKGRRLSDFLEREGAPGIEVTRRANIAWLAAGADVHVDLSSKGGVARLLWSPGEVAIVTDAIEGPRMEAEEFGGAIESLGWRLRVRPWHEPAGTRPEGCLTDARTDVLQPLRESLTPGEVGRAETLGAEAAGVMERAMRSLSPGMTEHEVAARVSCGLRERGIFTPVMLVAADERLRRFRHPIPTGRRVERVVMAAICAQRGGLFVSISRLVAFGEVDADLALRHDACRRVEGALHGATAPGVAWGDVLRRGIEAYEEAGYPGEWEKHHQGGPMGYEARDFVATPGEARVVREDQLVGWNPTVTGTKCEDTIITGGAEGPRNITRMEGWPVAEDGRPEILVLGS